MIYPKSLLEKAEAARTEVNDMINAAEKQGIKNFGPLHNLQK
jgi:hypothetical protein